MLKALRFVQGAVAKKDLLPALTHFVIQGGTVRGFNGSLALSSPIETDIECLPRADSLVKAIANCGEEVKLSITAAGRLSIKSGKFKAFVDCIDEKNPPHALPDGADLHIDGVALLKALEVIDPFVGNDASRPWTNGVLLKGQSAFATNNVMLAEYWTGFDMPAAINLPGSAVNEMLRIKEPPTRAQLTDTAITFHYESGRWIRAQLLAAEWPDVSKILDKPSNAVPLDAALFDALESIRPFVDKMGRVLCHEDGSVSTHEPGSELGASVDTPEFRHKGIYQIDMLRLLKGIATHADFTLYPAPCMFFGERLRGAVIGMRM